MKRFILLSLIVCLGLATYAQSPLKTVSFHKNPNEIVDLRELKEKAGRDSDLDGNKAARIRVKAQGFDEKKMLDFTVFPRPGMEVIYKEFQQGEMWVYVSSKMQGTLVIKYMGELEFKLPSKLEPKCGYDLVLGMETGTLVIRAIPSNADIFIDNEKVGSGGYASKAVSVGAEHHYKVVCDNYYPKEGSAYFSQREEKQIEVELEPNFGYITIKSEPSGAEVYVDDVKVGVTPYLMKKIPLGDHVVELRKTGYENYADMVTIKVRETNKKFENVKLVEDKSIPQPPVATTTTTPTTTTTAGNRTFTVNGVSFEMIAVKGGTFTMGCTSEQGDDCYDWEKPAHSVTLSDYYIGKFEVTQELWQAVMGNNPSYFKGNNLPVEKVSWNDVQEFIRKLNQKTGDNFRLPTEAEWEYAARGGNKSNGYKYSGSNSIGNVAWYTDNSGSETHQVGTKSPNELGIYDMSGNVWEWCQDWYGSYSSGSQTNPTGPSSSSIRVLRGGGWDYRARGCRVSDRYYNNPGGRGHINGFRLAMDFKQTSNNSSTQTLGSINASNYGVFSVAADRKVYFSKGNLQYQASTNTWRFAEHQWDIIGEANKNISSIYSGWIDLFGWGTSGYKGKNPWMASKTSADYANGNNDIAGTNYDWGVYNTISNGGGKSWRTLTRDEWVYVFNTRSTSSGNRYAKATVNGVNGVILLPDNWNSSNYSLSNTNKADASFSSNRISQADWQNKFEAKGAVFLPTAGYRYETDLYSLDAGYYWSTSLSPGSLYGYQLYGHQIGDASILEFWDGVLGPSSSYMMSGHSVRLVCSAEN